MLLSDLITYRQTYCRNNMQSAANNEAIIPTSQSIPAIDRFNTSGKSMEHSQQEEKLHRRRISSMSSNEMCSTPFCHQNIVQIIWQAV